MRELFASVKQRVGGLATRLQHTHAARAAKHYGANAGNVLAGGIAYFSLTSIAAGLIIAATISSYVIGRNPTAQDAVNSFLNDVVPGLVGRGDDGLVDQGAVRATPITGIVGVAAFGVLFFTATRYIGGLRQGVQTMLAHEASGGLQGKLRDFLALAVIAVLVLAGVALQVTASEATDAIAGWVSEDPPPTWVVRGPALAVTLIVDVVFVWMALKFLGRARPSARHIWPVLLAAAVAMNALRLGSSLFIGSVADNPVLAPFAAVIAVLIFADLVARIILLAAAWLGTAESDTKRARRGLSARASRAN